MHYDILVRFYQYLKERFPLSDFITMRKTFKRNGRFYVYIVECSDNTLYTGYTNNLEKRLRRHNEGFASKYTRIRRPVKFVWTKEYRQFKSAFKMERLIKKLTRKQKELLVKGKRLDKVLAGTRRV